MTRPRTVRLEILRHGPPHNQLLSPLTQYLALCGNHSGVTVNVPFEHAQFLARHDALSYRVTLSGQAAASRTHRELQLQITAQEMSQVLSGIPGLVSELREQTLRSDFIHFEMVLSASELALLPFELANAPNGFPGAGQPIVLQSQSPMCLTRRVNRVDNDRFRWPDRFKILFVEALPEADANVLVPQHLLALRKAIDPWIGHSSQDDDGDRVPYWVNQYLKVLRRATIQDMQRELATGDYTHIHILAHGVPHREGVDNRFALDLYDARDPRKRDTVSSSRLAAMVRSFRKDRGTELSLPAVVTIASCHGAEQGSVMGAGSSIAHALHEAEVPLVISAQFPLSFRGSVLMVEHLYQGLLWGEDPRILLSDLRRQLKAQLPETHDWASIVAYAALPKNVGGRLQEVRYQQVLRNIEAAFSFSDNMALRWNQELDKNPSLVPIDMQRTARELKVRLKDAKTRLRQQRENLSRDNRDRSRIAQQLSFMSGRLASTEKREAELEFQWDQISAHGVTSQGVTAHWIPTLKSANRHYRQAFDVDRSQTWALVQNLVLSGVINDWDSGQFKFWTADRAFRQEYTTAHVLSEHDETNARDPTVRAWAIGSLIELELLSLRLAQNENELKDQWRTVCRQTDIYVRTLSALVEDNDFQLFSTRRQLDRYVRWFYYGHAKLPPSDEISFAKIPGMINGLCVQLLEQLPAERTQ